MKELLQFNTELFDNFNDLVMFCDCKGKAIYVNNAVRNYGLKKSEILGYGYRKLINKNDLSVIFRSLKNILLGKKNEGILSLTIKKKIVYLHYSSSPLRVNGKIVGAQSILRDITKCNKAEEALKESEERFKLFRDNFLGLTFINDPGKSMVYGNKSILDFYGYKRPEEIINHKFEEYVSREHLDIIKKQDKKVISKGELLQTEEIVPGKSGPTFWLTIKFPIYKKGKPKLVGGFAIDITEKKKAEEELKESEERYKSLIENTKEPIFSVNKDGRFLFVNSFAAEMLGKTPEKLIGKTMWDLFPKKIAENQMSSILEVFKTKKSIEKDSVSFVNGKERYYNTWLWPIMLKKGKVIHVQAISHDITEKKKAEKELKESEEKYRSLYDSMAEGVGIISKEGLTLDANLSLIKIFGYKDKNEFMKKNKNPMTLIIPEDHEKLIKGIKNTFVKGVDVNQYFGIKKDGSQIIIDVIAKSSEDLDGNPISIVNIRDVTEQKKAEEELSLFNNLIEQSNDALFVINPESGRIIKVNERACKKLGYKREELLKLHIPEIEAVIPTDYSWKKHVKLMKKKKSFILEGEHKRKDGNTFPVEVSIEYIKLGDNNNNNNNNNNNDFILATARDITERRKSDEALKESENRYKMLYDSSQDAIMTLAPPSWDFTSGNHATVKMFNCKNEEEFVSLGPSDFSPEYQPDGQKSAVKAKKMILKAMKEGSNFFDWTHKKYKGKEFPATVLLTKLELEKGKPFLQATVRNISEQKNTLHEMEKFNKFAVDRELKMVELKNEINKILVEKGKKGKYNITK